jgi:predicted MFS family arabinose efflux permease
MTSIPSRKTFAALQYPNYRLWFIGQVVSLVGTWMQATAQGYLVYELTQSPAFLGYVSFANGLPTFLFSLYGGVIADRIPRRKMLVITQGSMMVLAAILAFLTFTKLVQPWHIIVLSFLLGTANAFDTPSRQSFVAELVDRQDMTNAIALNSTMFNIGTVVGPAAAGMVYAWVGPGWCFSINAASFIAVIAALLMMQLSGVMTRPKTPASAGGDLKVGLVYAWQNKTIRSLLANLAVVAMFSFGLMTLLPAWAVDVLNGNATTNGWLVSARGLGSLAGALMIAVIGSYGIRGKIWSIGYLLTPVFLVVFSFMRWLPLSLALLVCAGWSLMAMINTTNALVQSSVSDDLRGRVMGVYALVFMGGHSIGALIAGWVADGFGEPLTVVVFSCIVLAAAIFTHLTHPELRRLN